MSSKTSLAIRLCKKPKRVCQTLHFCELCKADIKLGEFYFDGGYGARGHVGCVQAELDKAGPT